DERVLDTGHGVGTALRHRSVAAACVDRIDVVGAGQRITIPGTAVDGEKLAGEEVDAHPDSRVVELADPRAQAGEEGGLELRQVELGAAVGGRARTGALPRQGSAREIG